MGLADTIPTRPLRRTLDPFTPPRIAVRQPVAVTLPSRLHSWMAELSRELIGAETMHIRSNKPQPDLSLSRLGLRWVQQPFSCSCPANCTPEMLSWNPRQPPRFVIEARQRASKEAVNSHSSLAQRQCLHACVFARRVQHIVGHATFVLVSILILRRSGRIPRSSDLHQSRTDQS